MADDRRFARLGPQVDRRFVVAFARAACVLALGTASVCADTYIVRNTNDAGAGSLREAIVNANAHPNLPLDQPDRIHFAIPESGAQTILLAAPLPPITDAVVIDGFTQPGSRANSLAVGNDANILIELNGINLADRSAPGLDVRSSRCLIRGLVIYRFGGDGVRIGSSITAINGNRVAGCFIGTNGAGTAAAPNQNGVRINAGATQNVIGGSAPADRNLLSGNVTGVVLDEGANNNTIAGSYIGTDRHGAADLANEFAIKLTGVVNTTIGGTEPGAGNVIIGRNPNPPVLDVLTTGGGTKIQGNHIGVNAAGGETLGYGALYLQTTNNLIGGTLRAARNVIAAQGRVAIEVLAGQNTIQGNYVGVTADGSRYLPSPLGIILRGGGSRVGGTEPGARNVILSGLQLSGSANTVQGNYFGVDASGTVGLPEGGPGGLSVEGGTDNVIGGATAAERNVIGGRIRLFGGNNNAVVGNYIGTDATGMHALVGGGVVLVDSFLGRFPSYATNHRIAGNVIATTPREPSSFYPQHGISLQDAISTTIQGNLIGVAADGRSRLGIGGDGINVGPAEVYPNRSSDVLITENVVAHCGVGSNSAGVGVNVVAGIRSRLTGNRIYANKGLGIDLGGRGFQGTSLAGVTPNDVGDSDTGSNQLQNYPVLSSVAFHNGNVTVKGTLNSAPNGGYRLEFFANESVDESGFGEGQFYLGFSNVTTNASGDASFEFTFPAPPTARSVSATATDAEGNTSEFSAGQGQLVNISTREHVGTGDRAAIGGFIITGSTDKRVLVRALGPSLAAAGVSDALADPTLELVDGNGQSLATNNDWQQNQREEIEATTIAPTHEKEAAIVRTLQPGPYTAVVRGTNDTTGIGLVEVYDLSRATGSRLANISTRGFVGTDENLMIGGFIIGPQGGGGARLAVRALGPSLANAGVPDTLADPVLELRDSTGTLFARNDNWKENQAAVEATGLAPAHEAEAVIVTTVQPGNYTAIVRGRGDTVGMALVEIYNVP